uniref:Uncharacterized protein n=1 Tax=Fagus sylvatica TaxID=28930 RepID=A0A2N9H9F2_FAGSY
MNRKNLVVDKVALFKKAQAFRKLMVRIGKTLCIKVLPISDLGKLGISGKLAMSTFQWHKYHIILSFDCETEGFGITAAGEISLLAVHFPVLILNNSRMLLMSQKNLLLAPHHVKATLSSSVRILKSNPGTHTITKMKSELKRQWHEEEVRDYNETVLNISCEYKRDNAEVVE